jgi:hypothetical protein
MKDILRSRISPLFLDKNKEESEALGLRKEGESIENQTIHLRKNYANNSKDV